MQYIIDTLGDFFSPTAPTPFPKKNPTQFWKGSRTFTDLHGQWYITNPSHIQNKFLKVLPLNIIESFGPETLAFLLMSDGYWNEGTIFICTDNFLSLTYRLRLICCNLNSDRRLVQKTNQ